MNDQLTDNNNKLSTSFDYSKLHINSNKKFNLITNMIHKLPQTPIHSQPGNSITNYHHDVHLPEINFTKNKKHNDKKPPPIPNFHYRNKVNPIIPKEKKKTLRSYSADNKIPLIKVNSIELGIIGKETNKTNENFNKLNDQLKIKKNFLSQMQLQKLIQVNFFNKINEDGNKTHGKEKEIRSLTEKEVTRKEVNDYHIQTIKDQIKEKEKRKNEMKINRQLSLERVNEKQMKEKRLEQELNKVNTTIKYLYRDSLKFQIASNIEYKLQNDLYSSRSKLKKKLLLNDLKQSLNQK